MVYLISSTFILPPIAAWYGRVPLPVWSNNNLRPLNILTCALNRHYVTLEMKKAAEKIAAKLEQRHEGTVVCYLDANFPFLNGFSLLPHLSHDDGEKLDLAFLYVDAATGLQIHGRAPSPVGYGVYEEPRKGEQDMPQICQSKGFWQYSILQYFTTDHNKRNMNLDEVRTRSLIKLCAENKHIGKIFLEPHLKKRMKLRSQKIRFHGCNAVRHDDHIHIQL